ncbi:MAG: hypothetical protein OQK12_18430 [Motiliproteus sp.]|nr:hypothetical protein [Motiliproteus sp.]MCW9052999.1 hypothetical protein [Motiliproteus sp.]
MKANRWSLINAAGVRDSGHEELQTDVMSFMAILGFCLMAIFAIVQSIPMEPSDQRPELETVVTLQNDLRNLSEQVLELRQKTNNEQSKVNQLLELQQSLSKQLSVRVEQGLQQLRQAKNQLENAHQRIDKQHQRLMVINNDIWQGEQTLSRLRKRIKLEARILHEQEMELAEIQKQRSLVAPTQTVQLSAPVVTAPEKEIEAPQDTEKVARALASLSKPKAPAPQALAPKTLAPETVVKPEPEKRPTKATNDKAVSNPLKKQDQGFNLRFKSDTALLNLLREDRIQLFAMTDHQTWKLSANNSHFRLDDSTKPRSFYEMTLSTVPNELVRQVQLQRSVFNPNHLTWGVVLPREIRSRINHLMQQFSYGILVITDQAQVLREES